MAFAGRGEVGVAAAGTDDDGAVAALGDAVGQIDGQSWRLEADDAAGMTRRDGEEQEEKSEEVFHLKVTMRLKMKFEIV